MSRNERSPFLGEIILQAGVKPWDSVNIRQLISWAGKVLLLACFNIRQPLSGLNPVAVLEETVEIYLDDVNGCSFVLFWFGLFVLGVGSTSKAI